MANPLTEDNLIAINQALAGLTEAQEIITKAKLAGMNMSGQEEKQIEMRGKLTRLKTVFFPNAQ